MTDTSRDKEISSIEAAVDHTTSLHEILVYIKGWIAKIQKQISECIEAKTTLEALFKESPNKAEEMNDVVVNLKDILPTLRKARVISKTDLQSMNELREQIASIIEEIMQCHEQFRPGDLDWNAITDTSREKEISSIEAVAGHTTSLHEILVYIKGGIAMIQEQISECTETKTTLKALIEESPDKAEKMNDIVVNLKDVLPTLRKARIVSKTDIQSMNELREQIASIIEEIMQCM